MEQYLRLLENCIDGPESISKTNRTGINHIGYHGDMCKYDLRKGFPLLTTKQMPYRMIFGEMLGFLRGYDNALDFRKLGVPIWDANANENQAWVENEHREGADDLGRIYGVQARSWNTEYDQLAAVVDNIKHNHDDRRLIVSHWNVSDIREGYLSLPPCHVMYQFGIQGGYLNLSMYQRSCDVPLGIPFNIAGYAWLLEVIARITGFAPGVFTHFMHDIHVYENQIVPAKEQLTRVPGALPRLVINRDICTLEDLETWVTPNDFELEGYVPQEAIKYEFSV